MTLTTHALTGAVAASFFSAYPLLAFTAAFASHFAVDALPHWDYPIRSATIDPHIGAKMKYDRAFFLDVVSIGFDMGLGIVLALFLFATPATRTIILIGAIGGILPDPLQFAYTRYPHQPLLSLQRFHQWIHTNHHLKRTPLFGICSQLLLIGVVIIVGKLL